MLLAVDVSDPARALPYATHSFSAQKSIHPTAVLDVWTFAHQVEVLWHGKHFVDRDAWNAQVAHKFVAKRPEMIQPGTQIALLLDQLADEVESRTGPVCVAVITDGGFEDTSPESLALIDRSVERLSNAPALTAIAFLGVHDHYRRAWEDRLRPLGSKADIRGDSDGAKGAKALSESSVLKIKGESN